MISPDRDCQLCPRLFGFIQENRESYPDFFNAPVPPFGEALTRSRLLIVGLAPGLRGANRTGRPFTGDFAGDLLYHTLLRHGFADGTYDKRPDDGLKLVDCRITNAVKCVPPENRPMGQEINTCNPFLASELESMESLRCIVALGGVAHGAVLKALGLKKSTYKFAHNVRHDLTDRISLVDSYHCSRYNTHTGRLTPAMFDEVFESVRTLLRGC